MTKKIILSILTICIIGIVFLLVYIKPYYQFIHEITGVSPLKILLIGGQFVKTDNRVNIVLLGKAGGTHDGPNLTDSIVVASYSLATNRITLISIPRDIWSSTLKDKINSAYAYGEAKKIGGGMVLAKAEIGAIVGIPIHYSVVIDFDKFKELIDFFGGIDVVVDRSFDDYKFPITGRENDTCNGDPEYKCRYEHISFQKGPQHMNGDTALKFVRSRYAEGEEGTDFARNKREEKILKIISQKILGIVKSRDLNQIRTMYLQLNKIIARDITNVEAAYIGKNVVLHRGFSINQYALLEDFFIVPKKSDYYGKYVLIPNDDNFGSIHSFVGCLLDSTSPNNCVFK